MNIQSQICLNCGRQMRPGARFCPYCGTQQAAVELPPPKHSGCLTLFLALAIVGNALYALLTWVMALDTPSSLQPLLIFSGLLSIACVGFAIAIYKWKKWGVYGYIGAISITMLINLAAGEIVWALQGLLPIALLSYLVRDSWRHME